MKKYLAVIALIMVFLAVLLPFASSSPDGLEKVAQTLGVEEHEPVWKGLMFDYSVEGVANSYVSAFLAGAFGTLMVLFATFMLGTLMAPKKKRVVSDNQ